MQIFVFFARQQALFFCMVLVLALVLGISSQMFVGVGGWEGGCAERDTALDSDDSVIVMCFGFLVFRLHMYLIICLPFPYY